MHAALAKLEKRREHILQQIQAIDRLRRGSLSRQFFKRNRAGSPKPQGPYFVLQGYVQGQKFSERIPAEQAPEVEPLVANYKRFEALAEEFVTVTDQITRLSQGAPEAKKTPDRNRPRTLPRSQRLHPPSQSPVASPRGAQSRGGRSGAARGGVPRFVRLFGGVAQRPGAAHSAGPQPAWGEVPRRPGQGVSRSLGRWA